MNAAKHLNISFFVLMVFVLVLIRFIYLEADPFFTKRLGDIQDEGYWTHNARSKVLFNDWIPDDMSHAIIFSPLYTGLTYLSFKIAGVSFFSARLVSALFSLATLIFLYLLVKSALGKKTAMMATLILGLNNAYLTYNRMALVETTLSFFLLLSLFCWYYSYRWPWLSILSGLTFSLAILTKITAIYFAPIFLLLWIIDYYKRRFKLSSFFFFGISTLIPLALYAYFIFFPNLPRFKINLMNSLAFSHKGVLDIITSAFRILPNNFFGDASVILLFMVFFIFMLFSVSFIIEEKSMRSFLNQSHDLILIALCWIMGGLIGMVFSNMHDRRFLMFLIPLSILASYSLSSWNNAKVLSLAQLSEKVHVSLHHHYFSRLMMAFLITYPFFSFFYLFVNLYYQLNYSSAILNKYFLITFLAVNLLLYLLLTFLLKNHARLPAGPQKWVKYLLLNTLVLTLLLPMFTFLKNTTHHLLLMLELNSYEVKAIIISFAIMSFLTLFIVNLYLWKRQDLALTSRTTKNMVMGYLAVNIILIVISFIYPSFTVVEASAAIGQYVQQGEVLAGSSANLLAIQNQARPLFYAPDNPDYTILNRNTKSSHQYVLVGIFYDGKWTPEQDLLSHKYRKVTFLREFPLFRYPTGRYKQVIQLYKVDEP